MTNTVLDTSWRPHHRRDFRSKYVVNTMIATTKALQKHVGRQRPLFPGEPASPATLLIIEHGLPMIRFEIGSSNCRVPPPPPQVAGHSCSVKPLHVTIMFVSYIGVLPKGRVAFSPTLGELSPTYSEHHFSNRQTN